MSNVRSRADTVHDACLPKRKSLALLIAVLAATAVAGCQGETAASSHKSNPQTEAPVVRTIGEGLIRRPADRAFVTVAVESRARSPKEAQRKSAETMAAVQKKLREAGLASEAIRTLSYYLELEYDYVKGKQVPRGYVASNTIEIRIDEVDRIGELIDVATAAGAGSISGPRFDLKERDVVEREALKQAVAKARAKAEAAAAGAGGTIERVLQIEEHVVSRRAPRAQVGLAKVAGAPEPVETPIAPGEIEVRAQVTLTAALK